MNDRPLPWAPKTRIDYCNGSLYCGALELRLEVGIPASRQDVLLLLMRWITQDAWQAAIDVELGRSGYRGVFEPEVFAQEAPGDPGLMQTPLLQFEAWAAEGVAEGRSAGAAVAEALDLCLPTALVMRRAYEARRLATAEQIAGLRAALSACAVEQGREVPVDEMLERAYIGELRRRDTAAMPAFLYRMPIEVKLPRLARTLLVSLANWLERPRAGSLLGLGEKFYPPEALEGWTLQAGPAMVQAPIAPLVWRHERRLCSAPPPERPVTPLTVLRLSWEPSWGLEFGGPRLAAAASAALEQAGFYSLAQVVARGAATLPAEDWLAHYRLVQPYFLAISAPPELVSP